MENIDLRFFLSDELKKRQLRNPKYSLRSFAAYLQISKSTLSDVLTGRRPIGPKVMKKIFLKLNVPQIIEKRIFPIPLNYTEATIDHLDIYTNWKLLTLLALIKTDDFKSDPMWMAKKLGLSLEEVTILIQKLIDKKIFELKKNGKLVLKKINFHFSPLEMRRELVIETQKSLFELHGESFLREEFGNRCFADGTIPIDPSDLPQARQMISEFRNKLLTFLERKSKSKKNRVYNFCISLTPMDHE